MKPLRETLEERRQLWTRRQWLAAGAGSLAALLLPGCRFPGSGAGEVPAPGGWAAEFAGYLLFGMAADPADRTSSLLSCVDFRARTVRQLRLPIAHAHQIVFSPCRSPKIWVIGNESESLCRVDVERFAVEDTVHIAADGFVSSGHAILARLGGEDVLAMTEYKLSDPSTGCVALRSPKDLSLLRRLPTHGSFSHVISHRPKSEELVVQNLGQPAGKGEQYSPHAELVIFDAKTLLEKHRLKPGREGRKLDLGRAHAAAPGEDSRFRQYAAYQLDSKATLYPDRGQVVVEFPLGPSISLWHPAESRLVREMPLPGLFPTHSFLTGASSNILVACRGAALVVVPKKSPAPHFTESWLAPFRTDMHVAPFERLPCENRPAT